MTDTPAMDAKTKELFEAAKSALRPEGTALLSSRMNRLEAAIAAFEPPPVKVAPNRIWANEYADGGFAAYRTFKYAKDTAHSGHSRTEVPFIEITPDICIVKPGEGWSENELDKLDDAVGHSLSYAAQRQLVNAIRTQCGVKP